VKSSRKMLGTQEKNEQCGENMDRRNNQVVRVFFTISVPAYLPDCQSVAG
jgi:hypothetical protein